MAAGLGPLVLIDGHNLFIRNYVRSPYTDANGERAGGTAGSIVSVRKIINDFRASNALVVWDGDGGSQRRKSIYKAYKEGRTVRLNEQYDFGETPEQRLENMRKQRNMAQEYLTMLGVPQVRADGVEADDLIAYIAGQMDHPHGCIIVSTDQDMLQLVSAAGMIPEDVDCHIKERDGRHELAAGPFGSTICVGCGSPTSSEVKVYSPIKKVLYDRQRFISDYGVLPENFRIVKALTGDKSDNIEGIKGFGDRTVGKTFPELAERMVSPDEILVRASALKGVLGKRLTEGQSRFSENLTLMDLSQPMLSATAARQAREALGLDLGCKEVEFRVRTIRDAVSFKGDNFVGVFREFVIRRRRFLSDAAGPASSIEEGEQSA